VGLICISSCIQEFSEDNSLTFFAAFVKILILLFLQTDAIIDAKTGVSISGPKLGLVPIS
jgi:hypothetical protein